MLKNSLFALALVMAASGVARAGGQGGSVGLGAEFQLSGFGGLSMNYDAGDFHVGGLLGFYDPDGQDNSTFGVGARFFYHLHSTAMSDFGLGGGLGIVSYPDMDPDMDRHTDVFLEPGFSLRLFLASNVALNFNAGIVLGVGDDRGIAITGGVQANAGVGVHYYFF